MLLTEVRSFTAGDINVEATAEQYIDYELSYDLANWLDPGIEELVSQDYDLTLDAQALVETAFIGLATSLANLAEVLTAAITAACP